jgi:hypothetical protein
MAAEDCFPLLMLAEAWGLDLNSDREIEVAPMETHNLAILIMNDKDSPNRPALKNVQFTNLKSRDSPPLVRRR